jgi:TetR/AcrR family transcriptional regulator, transcriptional repressor for nem operon
MSALTAKGRATRERIVAAAAALMYEHGVAVTSIDDVKVSAGVGSSQLYHYFADKQALVEAVIAHQAELVLTFQEDALDGVDGVAALRGWRDQIVAANRRFGPEGGCPVGSLASELADRDSGHRESLAAALDRWETAIRNGLVRMQGRGELRAGADPAALATALLAALQGGLLLAQVRRSTDPLATALDQAIDHVAGL